MPGLSQTTPEPALPREPRTRTTPRATSLVSWPRASEICAAPATTSRTMWGANSSSVGARGRDQGDFVRLAAANDANGRRRSDGRGAKRHLQRFAILDDPATD